jgi:hypothetical protein
MGKLTTKGLPIPAHIRVDMALLNSPAYIAVDSCAKALFIDLRARVNSYNNGNISAALSELKHRNWRSAVTLAKAIRQLEAVGLIAKTRKTVGVERGSKMCNLFRFTDLDVFEIPKFGISAQKATHDYKKITELKVARKVVAQASLTQPKIKKISLQKMERDATNNMALGKSIATDFVDACFH